MGGSSSKEASMNVKGKAAVLPTDPLMNVKLFEGLTAEEFKIIIANTKLKQFNKDEILFRVGDTWADLYIIISGKVAISSFDESGKLKELCVRSDFDFFGEFNQSYYGSPSGGSRSLITSSSPKTSLRGNVSNITNPEDDNEFQRPTQATVKSENALLRIINKEGLLKLLTFEWFKKVHRRLLKQASSSICESLKLIPFLSHMSEKKLKVLGELFSFCIFKKRDFICKQNDEGDAFYIILSGKAEVFTTTPNDGNQHVADLEAGAFFGEIALLQKIPRKASVTCTEECTCLKLTTSDFENFLMCVPSMKKGLDSMAGLRTAEVLRSSHVPFFEALDNHKLSMLAETCKVRVFDEDRDVIKQGDEGNSFYTIMNGSCKVFIKDVDDKGETTNEAEKCVATLKEGQYFGELALISEEKRLATVKTAERSVLLEFSKDAFHSIFFYTPESVADFAIRLQQGEVTLDHILHHPLGSEKFKQYLLGEFCSESYNFWIEGINYKKTPAMGRHEMMETIYHRFVSEKAKEQINIPATIRMRIEKRMIDDEKGGVPPIDLFDDAMWEIYKLMERDNFRRFKKSKFFSDVLDVVKPYQKTKVLNRSASSMALNKKLHDSDLHHAELQRKKEKGRTSSINEADTDSVISKKDIHFEEEGEETVVNMDVPDIKDVRDTGLL